VNSGIGKKIARLRRGAKARVLDLFAGCGSLSLGFDGAGFAVGAAIESDPDAALRTDSIFMAGTGSCRATWKTDPWPTGKTDP
jgi:site-specific DNA-cytosine methylase